jgi:predicted phosphodiesterase
MGGFLRDRLFRLSVLERLGRDGVAGSWAMKGLKIAVITDVHANLPALEAALDAIRAEGCDVIFHTGDAIAIGPYPDECLGLLLDTPKIQFVAGNHDAYFVDGLPEPQPDWMSDGEVQHQRWTHARLDAQHYRRAGQLSDAWTYTRLDAHLRSVLAQWPYILEREFEGVRTVFVHYGLALSGRDFVPVVRQANATDLDRMFISHDADLIFYGHHHSRSDVQGRARYVNPGSLGCHDKAVARYCVVEFQQGRYTVEHRAVSYDDTALFRTFERRDVPERQFIYRAFFGGRFHS